MIIQSELHKRFFSELLLIVPLDMTLKELKDFVEKLVRIVEERDIALGKVTLPTKGAALQPVCETWRSSFMEGPCIYCGVRREAHV